jgi:hypothetical protein
VRQPLSRSSASEQNLSGALIIAPLRCMIVEKLAVCRWLGGPLAFPTLRRRSPPWGGRTRLAQLVCGAASYRNSAASRLMTGALSQLEDQLIQLGNSLPRNLSSFSGPIDPPSAVIFAGPSDFGLNECKLAFVDRSLLLTPSNQPLDQRVHFLPNGVRNALGRGPFLLGERPAGASQTSDVH